jgi:hypothetical protein
VENGRDGIGHINEPTSFTRNDEEKPVGSLQNQVLQFLVGQKGRLERSIGPRVASSCENYEEKEKKKRSHIRSLGKLNQSTSSHTRIALTHSGN